MDLFPETIIRGEVFFMPLHEKIQPRHSHCSQHRSHIVRGFS